MRLIGERSILSLDNCRAVSLLVFFVLMGTTIFVAQATTGADDSPIAPREHSADVVKIGAIYSLQGAQSPLDLPSSRGAMLAAGEINAQGGINGRRIELVVCDAGSDPANAGQCAEDLLAGNVSALMGLSDTDMVSSAAQKAEEAGIPFVTSGATSPYLTQRYPSLFLACFSDDVQAKAGAIYAHDEMGLKTCALLVDGDMEYARLLAGFFKEKYQDLGGKILLEAFLNRSDAGELSQAVKDAGPDMIYLATGPDEAGAIILGMRREGVDCPVFGGDSFDSPLLKRAGMGSIVFSTHALLDENSTVTGKFVRSYRAQYGVSPENAFSALGYDAFRILADAINRSGSKDPQAILQALESTSGFKGVTGEICYRDHSRMPDKDVVMISLHDEEMVASHTVNPSSMSAAVSDPAVMPSVQAALSGH